nr:2-oxoacid:acceptor oxidoreductase family protein [bacterium]
RICPDAVIMYDSRPPVYLEEDTAIAGFIEPGMHGYGVPLRDLSTQVVKSSRSRNIVALGALAAIYNLALDAFIEAMNIRFARKPQALRDINEKALRAGYEYIRDSKERPVHRDMQAQSWETGDVNIINGNEAVARAALDAGLTLYAGYPITPATKIMEILAKKLPGHGGTVVQTEDEIAAAGHVVGAGYAGRRAMTATSGPGLCLMTEIINLAVEAEIPSLFIDSMRGGPSTGLPTKTEQSDLNLALYGGSGDSPRPVIAPSSVMECYTLTRRALEVAEAFQTPVILLLDFFLSNRFEDLPVNTFASFKPGMFEAVTARKSDAPFQRYADTDSGISPVSHPGMKGLQHAITGLEHGPRGFPNYEGNNHRIMTRKRFRKFDMLRSAWPEPEPVGESGERDIGIIAWGSTIGSALEAIRDPRLSDARIGGYFPRLLYPLQTGPLAAFADRCKTLLVVELNAGGQFAACVEQVLHRKVSRLCDVPAEPMPVETIVAHTRRLLGELP